MATIGSLNVELRTNIAKFAQGMDRANSHLKSFEGAANKAKGAAIALLAGLGVRELVGTIASFEKMEASLRTVTGSAEAADKAFRNITEFASQTPFQISEITDAFIKLKALGLDPSEKALRSYGNTASAMGKSLNQFIEAVADASTGEFERLKEFGIKSKSEGDRVTFTFQGMSTEIGKNSEEIQKYLESIGEVQFAGAMEEQMDTIGGAFSNLEDAGAQLAVALGDLGLADLISGVANAIGGFTRELTDLISWQKKEEEALDKFNNLIKPNIDLIKSYGITLANLDPTNLERVNRVLNAAIANNIDLAEEAPFSKISKEIQVISEQYASQIAALNKISASPLFGDQSPAVIQLSDNLKVLEGQINSLVDRYIGLSVATDEVNSKQVNPISMTTLETAEEYGKRMYELARQAFPEATQSAEEWAQAQADATQRFLELNDELYENESAAKKWLEDYKLLAQFLSGDELTSAVEQLNERFVKGSQEAALSWGDAWAGTFDRFAAGIGDAVASAILEQQTFSDALRTVVRSVIHQVISGLVEIGVKKVALSLLSKKTLATDTAASIAAAGTTAAAWAPAAAAVNAATFGAAAVAGTAALATTYATSNALALAGVAHDGLSSVPTDGTYLLQKGEKVVSNEDSKKLDMLLDQGMTQPTRVTVNIQAMDAAGVARVLSSPSAKKQIESFALRTVQDQYLRRGSRGGPLS